MKKLILATLLITTLLITACSNTTPQDENMYYPIYDSIYKVDTNTKKSSLLYSKKGSIFDDNFIIQGDWLYGVIDTEGGLCDYISPYIFKIRTNGEDFQMLADGIDFTIYDGNIYYMKQEFSEDQGYFKSGIYKMSLDGEDEECITDSKTIEEFTVYKSRIYYVNYVNDIYYLESVDMAGGPEEIICSGDVDSWMNCLQGESNYIYFNDGGNIYKVDITSGEKSTVLEGADMQGISPGYIYYTDDSGLYRMSFSDGSEECIMSGNSMWYIRINGDYMIITGNYFNEKNYDENTAKYLCRLNGDGMTVIKKYFCQ